MATFNASANLFGLGSLPVVGSINTVVNKATFSGAGLLDDFRVSNRYEYDPQGNSPGPGDMRLRKARFSQEGIFGDD